MWRTCHRPGVINREHGSSATSKANATETGGDIEPTVARPDEARHGPAGTERDAQDVSEGAARHDREIAPFSKSPPPAVNA